MTTLFCALASSTGCDAGQDGPDDPNPSGGGGAPYAPAATASPALLEAYSATQRYRLGLPMQVEALADGSAILYLRSGPRDLERALYVFDLASGEERRLLGADDLLGGDEEELSVEERARRERMRQTARGIASYRLSADGARILIPLSGRLFLVDRARVGQPDAIRELESEAGPAIDPRFSPTGSHVAVVRGGDLYVIDVATGAEARLTTKPSDDVTHGLAEFVAQEEMGRMRGFWWAPDGRSLAYQETDTAGMERMHILDPMHPERAPEAWPYPRPGAQNAAVRLGIISIAGGPTTWIDWDADRFPYLASVTWPTAGPLTVLVQDREQEEEVLLAVEPATGQATELLRERDAAWINLDTSVPRWLDAERFLWSSEREGSWRLELRDRSGALVRALTPEGFGYRRLIGVDETAGRAWIAASEEPTETHVFTVPLRTEAAPTQKSEGRGEHDAVIAARAPEPVWVDMRTPLEGAATFTVRRGDEEVGTIRSEVEAPPFTPNVTFETIGEREWRAAVVRPRDFDPALRYPVILYVYGGPHVRYVTAVEERYLLSQWQADHNFIVVTIDGRGTPGRGREWERAIDGDFISAPLEDQVAALRALGEAHPEMDMERVGVWGWSFGGYFSAMAVLRAPEVFRAAVAGAPVSEWRDYDTHYTERYLGVPEAAGEEGPYHVSSALTYAGEVDAADHRPLLILHGTADDNVYFSHALKLQNALFRSGRPAELLALSGLTHMVPEPVVMRRMHQRIIAFFEEHLRR